MTMAEEKTAKAIKQLETEYANECKNIENSKIEHNEKTR